MHSAPNWTMERERNRRSQSAFDIMKIVRLTVVRSEEHNKQMKCIWTLDKPNYYPLKSKHFSFRIFEEGAWLPTTCRHQCERESLELRKLICRSVGRETNFPAFWHYSLHAIKVMHDGIKNERNEQKDQKMRKECKASCIALCRGLAGGGLEGSGAYSKQEVETLANKHTMKKIIQFCFFFFFFFFICAGARLFLPTCKLEPLFNEQCSLTLARCNFIARRRK